MSQETSIVVTFAPFVGYMRSGKKLKKVTHKLLKIMVNGKHVGFTDSRPGHYGPNHPLNFIRKATPDVRAAVLAAYEAEYKVSARTYIPLGGKKRKRKG